MVGLVRLVEVLGLPTTAEAHIKLAGGRGVTQVLRETHLLCCHHGSSKVQRFRPASHQLFESKQMPRCWWSHGGKYLF